MLSILPKRRAPTILMTGGSSEVCRPSERKMTVELSQPEGVKEMGGSVESQARARSLGGKTMRIVVGLLFTTVQVWLPKHTT